MKSARIPMLLGLLHLVVPTWVAAQNPAAVGAAVQKLVERVGDEVEGREIKRDLRINDLIDHIEGQRSEFPVLREIAKLFEGESPAQDTAEFKQVRDALRAWLANIEQSANFRLAAWVRAQKERQPTLRPFPASALAERRARLDTLLANLDQFLLASGSKNAEAWKQHLDWELMLPQLAAQEPDPDVLEQVARKYLGWQKGLGHPHFVDFRGALTEYLWAERLLQPRPKDQDPPPWHLDLNPQSHQAYLEEIALALEDYAIRGRGAPATRIGASLEWLERSGQSPEVVRELRRKHGHANVVASISTRLAAAGINDTFDNDSPIREFLFKTDIRGSAHTEGRFVLASSPSLDRLSLVICTYAHADATQTGYRGKVRVHSEADSEIQGSKEIFFSPSGWLTSTPAIASVDTESYVTGIEHRWRLVRRIAAKKAAQYKEYGENYASNKAARQAEEEMDKRVDELLVQANQDYQRQVRRPLNGLGVYPRGLAVSSSPTTLDIRAMIGSLSQIAAWGSPPPAPAGHHALFQIHESAVRNGADRVIAGMTLKSSQASQSADLLKQVLVDPPTLGGDEEWQMRLSRRQAIDATFRNGEVRFAIRGEYFKSGAREMDREMEIAAVFRIDLSGPRPVLRRKGDVTATFLTPGRGGFGSRTGDIAIRTVFTRKFEDAFQKPLEFKDLRLPGRWEKAGLLRATHADPRDGWLTLAFDAENLR